MSDIVRKRQLKRGIEVVRLGACGYSDGEIAKTLDLTIDTVKSRFKTVYPIIGARSRAHATSIMLAEGLLNRADLNRALMNRRFPPGANDGT